jgi:DNA-binding transcriptional ArsR family regulator
MTQTPIRRTTMWALAHPLRLRLFELLATGPATASQLARKVGESRGSASYHLRVLARMGAIQEDAELGTKRERWWRRADESIILLTDPDLEGRAITDRAYSVFYARENDVRRRFVTGEPTDEWRQNAFVGNWFLELTPEEADALGRQLFALVDEARRRNGVPRDAELALVAVSVLPVLEE